MKQLLLLMSMVLGLFVYTSCEEDDDHYSLDKFWLSSGTITKTTDYYYVTTDGGSVLWPAASSVNESYLEDGMRILVNYTILDDGATDDIYDYYVKINDVDEILTKPYFEFTEETPVDIIDSIGNDPIKILDTWFTGDYLNVEFNYGGGVGLHFVNLVYDATNPVVDETGEIILELKHNDNGDPYSYVQWGVASFDISGLQQEDVSELKLLIRSNYPDGEYDYNKVLIYNYEELSQTMSAQKVFNNKAVALDVELN